MIKIFIDTNILIDLIADRKPFSKFAIEIFSAAENGKVNLFASSHSIATTHYLLKKNLGEKELRGILIEILNYIEIIPVDVDVIKRSLKSSHSDFEDAIQIIAAQSIGKMDCIVTRNVKDFKGAEIPVFSSDEFVRANL